MSVQFCFSCGAQPPTERCPNRCLDTGLLLDEADELRADLAAAQERAETLQRKLVREQARKRAYKDERDALLSERVDLQRAIGDARMKALAASTQPEGEAAR